MIMLLCSCSNHSPEGQSLELLSRSLSGHKPHTSHTKLHTVRHGAHTCNPSTCGAEVENHHEFWTSLGYRVRSNLEQSKILTQK